jgi:FemAB-related protein (PEP-CTERM system-associated)
MQVERVRVPGGEWDEFVEAAPGATLAHAAGWATVVREAYGLEPVFLAARSEDGKICGVLPLVRFRTLLGGRQLVSMPFLDTGGILASTPEAELLLREAALAETREWGASALELRQATPLASMPTPQAVDRIDLVLSLPGDEEVLWKALSAKVRNQTRKATREGLSLAEASSSELVERFYTPFRVNMRDLGSPVHAAGFYRAILHAFGPRLRVIVVQDGVRPVGGLIALHYAGRVTVPWASTLRAERARCPNNLIYWEALRWAVQQGARAFDFGRSPPESGTHRFKLGWGAVEHPLAWLRLDPSGSMQVAKEGQGGGALRRLSRIWTRLPVPIASTLGPLLRRRLSQ